MTVWVVTLHDDYDMPVLGVYETLQAAQAWVDGRPGISAASPWSQRRHSWFRNTRSGVWWVDPHVLK